MAATYADGVAPLQQLGRDAPSHPKRSKLWRTRPKPRLELTYENSNVGPARPSLGSAAADVFPVRLDPELRAALEQRAETDHTTASDIVRHALRSYLHVA